MNKVVLPGLSGTTRNGGERGLGSSEGYELDGDTYFVAGVQVRMYYRPFYRWSEGWVRISSRGPTVSRIWPSEPSLSLSKSSLRPFSLSMHICSTTYTPHDKI